MYQHVCFCSKANKDLVTLSIFSLAFLHHGPQFEVEMFFRIIADLLPTPVKCATAQSVLFRSDFEIFFESSSHFFPKKTRLANKKHTHTHGFWKGILCLLQEPPRAPIGSSTPVRSLYLQFASWCVDSGPEYFLR